MKDETIPEHDQHSHDPLCHIEVMRSQYTDDEVSDATLQLFVNVGLCDCKLIARVREDSKQTILQAAYESAPSQVRQDEVARIYNTGYTAALGDAVAAVFHCLAWEDEQLDADGHPRLYLWQDHALAAINKLRGQP